MWSSYRDELTSWLCLLDDRFADELQEAEQSAVPVEQGKLDVGKAARSSKLWFLLKQSMSKFQRAQDLIRLIEIQQRGASAGYEFWRMLNKELSVRSRVEGQALREQALNLYPPKYLKRPLDVMRWYMTELMKYESQVTPRFPELKIHEQEAVLGVLKHLDEDAKRYLLLHQTTSGLDAMLRGLQFYDEQLRVLSFQKEHQHGGYLNAFGAGKGDNPKGKKGSELLRVGALKNSELLRATPSHSERLLELSELSERLLRATKAFRATPSYSEWLLELSKLSERLFRATRALKARKKLRRLPSYSELGAPKNSELLRATQSTPSLLRALPETPSYYPASPEPAVSGIASSSEPPQ